MTASSEKQAQLQSSPEVNDSVDLRAAPPTPKLRLHINDIRHPAFKAFLSLIPDLESVLGSALVSIVHSLYTVPRRFPSSSDETPTNNRPTPTFKPSVPPTRSVTIFLRDIGGVAYTTDTELDDDHKEIHLSLSYIDACTRKADPAAELHGVLTHELVHCYQHTAPPASDNHLRPPGGLIEGIADFVRLKAGLAPPHWKRPTSAQDRAEKWDQGYQHTAYFLAWLEDVHVGRGAIGMLNDRLLRVGYYVRTENEESGARLSGVSREEDFWEGLFGTRIDDLWHAYGVYLDRLGFWSYRDRGTNEGTWEDEIVNCE